MKTFDVIIGNPPFSSRGSNKTRGKRAKELYTRFFEWSVRNAPTVAMVLPTTDRKVQQKHNNLLKTKANIIKHINHNYVMEMSVDIPMWYVVVDGSDSRPEIEFRVSGAPRNKIPWTKGKVNMTHYKKQVGHHGRETRSPENTVTIYHKINRKGLVVKYGNPRDFRTQEYFPSTGFAVLMPQTITDRGWSNVQIVECNNSQVAFNGMNIVFTETRVQAERLIALMETADFQRQANRVKQGFNNMTISCLRAIQIDDEAVDAIFT